MRSGWQVEAPDAHHCDATLLRQLTLAPAGKRVYVPLVDDRESNMRLLHIGERPRAHWLPATRRQGGARRAHASATALRRGPLTLARRLLLLPASWLQPCSPAWPPLAPRCARRVDSGTDAGAAVWDPGAKA